MYWQIALFPLPLCNAYYVFNNKIMICQPENITISGCPRERTRAFACGDWEHARICDELSRLVYSLPHLFAGVRHAVCRTRCDASRTRVQRIAMGKWCNQWLAYVVAAAATMAMSIGNDCIRQNAHGNCAYFRCVCVYVWNRNGVMVYQCMLLLSRHSGANIEQRQIHACARSTNVFEL